MSFQHTPGPWHWFVNNKAKTCYLATWDRGRIFVMQMVRWGMQGAIARFQVPTGGGGIMTDVHQLGNPDHNGQIRLRHPDAALIASAPDLGDQVYALTGLGWTVEKLSMYDEEGVEGWMWTEPNGTEHTEMGDWSELPTWPQSAREAVAKAGTWKAAA